MTAEQSGFGTEVTARTYQADNLIFQPLALPWLVLTGFLLPFFFFSRQMGAPTPLGSNRLDFPQCNVVSDTPPPFKLCSCVVKSLQCFSTNNLWHKDVCVPLCNCKKHLREINFIGVYFVLLGEKHDSRWDSRIWSMNALRDEDVSSKSAFMFCFSKVWLDFSFSSAR